MAVIISSARFATFLSTYDHYLPLSSSPSQIDGGVLMNQTLSSPHALRDDVQIVPQGTAGGPSVDMASLQSCAAAMAAVGGASAQGFSPFLVQLPAPSAPASSSSSAPSSPGTSSSSPASPGQSHAHQRHQAQLAQLAQHYAALQHQHQQQQRAPAPAAGTPANLSFPVSVELSRPLFIRHINGVVGHLACDHPGHGRCNKICLFLKPVIAITDVRVFLFCSVVQGSQSTGWPTLRRSCRRVAAARPRRSRRNRRSSPCSCRRRS